MPPARQFVGTLGGWGGHAHSGIMPSGRQLCASGVECDMTSPQKHGPHTEHERNTQRQSRCPLSYLYGLALPLATPAASTSASSASILTASSSFTCSDNNKAER
jgi:hypothetical protein